MVATPRCDGHRENYNVVVVVANISVLCWSAQLVHINIEHLLVTAVPVMDQHDQNKDSAERSL